MAQRNLNLLLPNWVRKTANARKTVKMSEAEANAQQGGKKHKLDHKENKQSKKQKGSFAPFKNWKVLHELAILILLLTHKI